MSAANEQQFLFELEGERIPVYSFDVDEGLSQTYEVNVVLATREGLSPDRAVGKKGVLILKGEFQDRYFHGIVCQFEQSSDRGQYQIYALQLVPLFWLLKLTRNVRIFQNLTTPEIVKKVLKDSDVTTDLYRFSLTKSYEPREYCVQYRESDFDFVSRLLAEEGIHYQFEHEKGRHTMTFGDGVPNYKAIEGKASVQFNTTGALVKNIREYVTEISKTVSIRSGKVTLADYNFEKPSFKLSCEASGKRDQKLELYDYPGNFMETARGSRLSKVDLGQAELYRERIEGTGLVPNFRPGGTFTLEHHPAESFNAEYALTRVIHVGTQPQTLQEIASDEEGTSYHNNFDCLPAKVPFVAEKAHGKPSVDGVQTAVVTGPKGEEIYTDEFGRIKVQFHWDREGKMNERSSCWVRVSQKTAGAGWGELFIPRIGQEVIVDFIDGDPDRPIVTGCVYNGLNKPPCALPGEKSRSTIRSNSTPGGGGSNEIRFDDKKGSEEFYIHAQKDQNEVVENDMNTLVKNDRKLTVQKNRTTLIKEADDTLTVEAGGRTVSVKADEAHKNDGDFEHKVGGNYTLEVGGNLDIKVSGVVTIQGNPIHLNP